MKVVFDASTLILLAKTELLVEVANTVTIIIPKRVKEEYLFKKSIDSLLIARLIDENRIEVEEIEFDKNVKKLQSDFRIGRGEAEAIWLSRKLNLPLAVDDGQAIKTSKVIGQKFTTAIHFLHYLVSQKRLKEPIAIEKLAALSRYGRYSKRIIENAKKRLKGEQI